MKEIKKLSHSFEKTLADSDLQNVTTGLAETITDSFLENGFVKDIPIIGTIVGLTKSSIKIADRLLIKKIIYFLEGLKDVSKDKREKLISKIDNSSKYEIKVGEKLIYILDKCDDHVASRYIAQLFKAFIEEELDYRDFLRGASIIQKVFIEDFKYFLELEIKELEKEIKYEESISDFENSLLTGGILVKTNGEITVRDQDDWKRNDKYVVEGGSEYLYLTDIGHQIKNILTKTGSTLQ